MSKKRIVVIGGGTGTFTILSGLKRYPHLDLSVIVSMMDDGGSNRMIRDQFGLLPVSDLRQCMVALASENSDLTLRKLFTYRYNQGVGISGMTFGNLFMAALTDIYKGDQKKAIKETCKILGVKGSIIPVTFEKTNLMAIYADGHEVLGEHNIDEPVFKKKESRIVGLKVIPKVRVNSDAVRAILAADLIILGPGDLYTSILPNLVVGDISKSFKKTRAKILYVSNLMTKFGQTTGFTASDFLNEIQKYLGGRNLDFVLLNKSKPLPSAILNRYKKEKAEPVRDDLRKIDSNTKVIRKNLISFKIYEKSKGDYLLRSLIRHDSAKLAKAVVDLINTSF